MPLPLVIDLHQPFMFLNSGRKLFEPVTNKTLKIAKRLSEMGKNQALEYTQQAKKGFVEVTYSRKRNNIGRSFIAGGKIGLTTMERASRNTMLQNECSDYDLVASHIRILLNIVETLFPHSNLKDMVMNRNKYFDELIDIFDISKADAKELISVVMYGGTVEYWMQENGLDASIVPPAIWDNFRREVRELAEKIKEANPEFVKALKRDKNNDAYSHNDLGRFLANYLQHQETIVIDKVMHYANLEGWLTKGNLKIGTYEFDGFKLFNQCINDPGLVLDDLNHFTNKTFGNWILFDLKPLDKIIDVGIFEGEVSEGYDEDSNVVIDILKIYKNKVYLAMKDYFESELGWCKIIQSTCFVRKYYEDGIYKGLVQMSGADFKSSYGHVKILDNISFIVFYLGDPNMRIYERMDSIPHDKVCPDNVFNLWTPYEMETITDWTDDSESIDFWINHFHILCGRDQIITDYFLDFLGQLIKYPSVKPGTAIDLISRQGAGKNTIFELCKIMFGSEKVFNCSDPARDIWGQFNPQMKDAIFVLLNELNKKDTITAEGKIKDLITEPTYTLSSKGLKQITLPSYHRFISFFNSDNGDAPKRTTKDDRRNLIIRSSDELIGNKDYFEEIYNNRLRDMNGIKCFYEFLKSRPRVDTFHRIPLPCTEYQENLKESNRCPIELFIEDLVKEKYEETGVVEIVSPQLFKLFNGWKSNNGIVYDVNSKSFGVRLKNLNIVGVSNLRHTNKGNLWGIDIPRLKETFKIGCLVVLKEDETVDDF